MCFLLSLLCGDCVLRCVNLLQLLLINKTRGIEVGCEKVIGRTYNVIGLDGKDAAVLLRARVVVAAACRQQHTYPSRETELKREKLG